MRKRLVQPRQPQTEYPPTRIFEHPIFPPEEDLTPEHAHPVGAEGVYGVEPQAIRAAWDRLTRWADDRLAQFVADPAPAEPVPGAANFVWHYPQGTRVIERTEGTLAPTTFGAAPEGRTEHAVCAFHSGTVTSVVDGLATLGWPLVAKRLGEIEEALGEEDGTIDLRSLQTLESLLRNGPGIPEPRLGAADDGMLSAVWSLVGDGVFAAEFLKDGTVGCAAVLDVEGPSHSETLELDQAHKLLSWLAKLGLLKRR